ncbi:MAG: DUF177 domain-containing protein [Myxococcaceae bacterium]|nr:DUF177 domain-containing protein [Myxococcaceae bacterium]
MRVKIEEIQKDGGLHLDEPIPKQTVQAALDDFEDGWRADEGFQLKAHLLKVGEGVLLKGDFTAKVVAPCKRCVTDVLLTLPHSFTLNLVDASLAQQMGVEDEGEDDGKGERNGSFSLDEAEQDTFDGKVIDLDPIIREQILLALPMSAVCRDDCAGLCTVCGQNLNEKRCGCDTKVIDPRLGALKDIKLN